MKYILIIGLISLSSCNGNVKYPVGGLDYPKNIDNKDTNLYHYQLKDVVSKREAFALRYEYLMYRPFDEQNLSIKPMEKETFRLTFSATRGETTIIRINEDSIIIKTGDPSLLYDDGARVFSEPESFQLAILRKYFPIDTSDASVPGKKKYLDSIVELYPQILDKAYYHKLFEKTLIPKTGWFEYRRIKVPITKDQFNNLVDQINASGYWALATNIECDDPPADGYGFTLEANTKLKYKSVGSGGCPTDNSFFPKLCQKIISLAKMDSEIMLDRKWEAVPVDTNQ